MLKSKAFRWFSLIYGEITFENARREEIIANQSAEPLTRFAAIKADGLLNVSAGVKL